MLTKLTTKQNNTLTFTSALKDSNGVGINITGATLIVKIINGSTVVITKNITSHTTPLSGITTCYFSPAETALFPIGIMGYELQWALSNGDIYSFDGNIEIKEDK